MSQASATLPSVTRSKVEERLRKMVQRWPQVSGYHLNPDPAIVEGIVQALVRSTMAYGYPYCPCRDISGDPKQDRANICPCRWHHREIREDGYCKCVLFVGDQYDPVVAYRPRLGSQPMNAVNSIRQRSVTVYSTYWCAHSRRVKALLERNGIPFVDIDIDQNEDAAQQVQAWNRGYRSVPTLHIRLIVTEPSIEELERLLLTSRAYLEHCVVYMTTWCAQSRRTLAWLDQNQITYQAVDIDRDAAAAAQVETWNKGFRSSPTLDITLRLTEPTGDQLSAALGLAV